MIFIIGHSELYQTKKATTIKVIALVQVAKANLFL
jgi:hypothetical protein